MKEKIISFKYNHIAYDIFIFLVENTDINDFEYDVIIDVIDIDKQHQCIHSKVSFTNHINNTDIDICFASDNLYLAKCLDRDLAELFTDTISSKYLDIYSTEISDIGKSNIYNLVYDSITAYVVKNRLDITYHNNIIKHFNG